VFVAQVAIIQWKKRRKNGDCPLQDLAKSGYKSEMKYKSLIILLCVWLYAMNLPKFNVHQKN
jgi:hypothetical protein